MRIGGIIIAIFAALLLLANFSLASVLLVNDNATVWYVGMANSTSFIFKNSSNEETAAYWYSNTVPIDVNASTYLLDPTSSGTNQETDPAMPVQEDLANGKIWFMFGDSLNPTSYARHFIRYIDMPTMSVSGNIFTSAFSGGTGFQTSTSTLGYNKSNLEFFWTIGSAGLARAYRGAGYTNGTQLPTAATLDNYFDTSGSKNFPFYPDVLVGEDNAVIRLINQANYTPYSSENLAAITTGFESGIGFFNYNGSAYMIFSSDAPGNVEIYFAQTNQTATSTRLTTTAQNESLADTWQSGYGTVYIIYYIHNYPYLDYFCPATNSALGTTCTGEIGYGGAGEETPNLISNFTQDSLYLHVVDNGRCLSGCSGFAIFNEDWVTVTFITNNNTIPTNASCQVTDGVNVISLISCNPANPFTCIANQYSANAVSMSGSLTTISCVNPFNTSQSISAPFIIEDTIANRRTAGWGMSSGSAADNIFDDIVFYKDRVKVKTELSRESGGSGQCFTTIGSKVAQQNRLADSTVRTGVTFYKMIYDYYTGTGGFALLPAGYNYYKTVCGAWLAPGIRMSSNAEIRRLFAIDKCSGRIDGVSTIGSAYYVDYIPYTNATFYVQQVPTLKMAYTINYYPNATKTTQNTNPICSVTLTNNDTATDLWTITLHGEEFQSQCYNHLQDLGVDCATFMNIPLVDGQAVPLIAGNYSVSTTCSNNNPDLCVTDSSDYTNFTVLSGANCAGSTTSCGTEACNACGTTNFLCENNETISIPQSCTNQRCVNETGYFADSAILDYIDSNKCSIYNVVAGLANRRDSFACINKPSTIFSAGITRNGQAFDIGANNVQCEGGFMQVIENYTHRINVGLSFTLNWNSQTKQFERTYKSMNDEYGEDFLECGNTYRFIAECSSPLFAITHTGVKDFTVGGLDFCSDGTSSGTCVFDRTKQESDKPKYCSTTLNIVNNSAVCGCPSGMKVNATGNTCSGNAKSKGITLDQFNGIWIWFTSNWWILLILILIINILFPAPAATIIQAVMPKQENK